MLITYATAHRWTKPVQSDPTADFGKNASARLRATLSRLGEYDIHHVIAPLDNAFLEWFLPLYETRINEKANPRVFDIAANTLGSTKPEKYFSMTLYEHGQPIGGTIFSLSKSRLSIAYRTYHNTWTDANLPANPSAYTEYLLNVAALTYNKPTIIHGKDRNPYGLNSSIGLANFKFAAGCHPELPKVYEVATLDTNTLTTDALIFAYPPTGTTITDAYLVADAAGQQKWGQIAKYPHLITLTIIPRLT